MFDFLVYFWSTNASYILLRVDTKNNWSQLNAQDLDNWWVYMWFMIGYLVLTLELGSYYFIGMYLVDLYWYLNSIFYLELYDSSIKVLEVSWRKKTPYTSSSILDVKGA